MISLLKDIIRRKDLLKYLVITQLKLSYANKVLGYFWSLLDPLMMMVVYIILITFIFKRKDPQFPVLIFSSLLAWQWFTFSLTGAVNSISGKSRIILSIRFPLAILPISVVFSHLLRYFFGILALIPMLFIFNATPTATILWFPLLVIVQCMLTLGLCLIASILGVYFKDMNNIIQFVIRIWFYGSPILYSAKEVLSIKSQTILYMLNPFAAIFTSYKAIFVWGESPSGYIWWVFVISALVLFIGLAIFSKYNNRMAKDL
jgi:ABC-type polysaccharide/polyol phosphate export permease